MKRTRNAYAAPSWAAEQRLGDVGTKATLLTLANYADERYSCFPGQETIADETEQSVSTVYRQLKKIERWGLIRREKRYTVDPDSGKKVRTSDRFFLDLDATFHIKVHGADYDAATQGRPNLPVNLTGRSDQGEDDLTVNVTGRCTGSPTGQTDRTYRSPVTDELLVVELLENSLPPSEVERRAHDVRAHADTPDKATVSSDSSVTLAEDVKIPTGAASNRKVRRFLPEGWAPSAPLLEWAAREVPGLDVEWETQDFVAYWSENPSKTRAKAGPDWDRTWQNRMRDRWIRLGLDRRAKPAAEPDLFTVDVAGHRETAAEIADTWADWWHKNRGPVLPSVRENLRKLLFEALAGGATADQVKAALKLRNEPCPWPKEFTAALAGHGPRAAAGGMSFRERDKHNADMASAEGWQRVADRVAAGTEDDPNESLRVIIERSMRKASEKLAGEQDSTPGPASSMPAILRGEIAQ